MSISFNIPKDTRFIQRLATFTANFNVPSLGVYDFNNTGNAGVFILQLNPNSLYILDTINIGGTIPENEYNFAISTVPLMTLKYSNGNQAVFPSPLPVVNFIDNQQIFAWIYTDKSADTLAADLTTGVLTQTPFLVGVTPIKLFVQFNVYEITDTNFISLFKQANYESNIGYSAKRMIAPDKFYTGD